MLLDAVTVYAVNTLLALLVAGMTAAHWKSQGRGQAALYWMLGALALAASDFSFLIRVWWGFDVTTVIATGLVTAALLFTLRGVGRFCGERLSVFRLWVVFVAHVAVMSCLVEIDATAAARMAVNSAIWASVVFVAARILANPGPESQRRWGLPAAVMGAHGVFHVLRLAVLGANAEGWWHVDAPVIESASLAEASLFAVALFTSLIWSDLRQRQKALAMALEEVKALSGLLAICSCCKKIREDSGHWTRIESYLSEHSDAQFTHGICPDCSRDLYPELHLAAAREPRQAVRVIAPQAEIKLR